MPVYLVRHADAGSRSSWHGDDADRPLSDKGRDQAAAIVASLAGAGIHHIVSSPSRRCVETVRPLADRLGLDVDTSDILLEGGDADEVVAYLLAVADRHPVLCSHGDLIPKVLRRLSAAGMRAGAPNEAKKGSIWVLDVDGGTVTNGTYVVPHEPHEMAS